MKDLLAVYVSRRVALSSCNAADVVIKVKSIRSGGNPSDEGSDVVQEVVFSRQYLVSIARDTEFRQIILPASYDGCISTTCSRSVSSLPEAPRLAQERK